MIFLYMAIAAIAPVLVIWNGKRALGNATHPAAIFILAWILCIFLFSLAGPMPFPIAIVTFGWVALCFWIIPIIKKKKGKEESDPNKKP